MMATDGETPEQPRESDILPDEAAVIAERLGDLDELKDDEYLSIVELADELGFDRD